LALLEGGNKRHFGVPTKLNLHTFKEYWTERAAHITASGSTVPSFEEDSAHLGRNTGYSSPTLTTRRRTTSPKCRLYGRVPVMFTKHHGVTRGQSG